MALRKPAPSVNESYPGYDCAVYCRMALMAFGVRVGFACSIAAMVPLTTGAAMLVPLRLRYGNAGAATDPGRSAAARLSSRVLPGTANHTVPTPGATRSGFAA